MPLGASEAIVEAPPVADLSSQVRLPSYVAFGCAQLDTVDLGQTRFLPYDSPFNPFSRLRARSLLAEMSSISTPGRSTSDRIGTSVDPVSLDLTPLKLATLGKIDPARQLCRFEIPGRGECKEEQCEDVHRSDYDPTGECLALILLPFPLLPSCQFSLFFFSPL